MQRSGSAVFVEALGDGVGQPDSHESGFRYIIRQYEEVVVRSLITSFGLEMFIQDRRGGDVDTINTVRDPSVTDYANKRNQRDYENRGEYNPADYHANPEYIRARADVSQRQKAGNLYDAYSGKKLAPNQDVDLDHTISAKEIHDDPGRVLAGISGPELANMETNLNPTHRSVNRSKKAKSASDFSTYLDEQRESRRSEIAELKSKDSLTNAERKRLERLEQLESVDTDRLAARDRVARREYESRLARTYYTSPKFLKDTARAALKRGTQLGIRQAVGLILAEVWFSVREEFPRIVAKMKADFDIKVFIQGIIQTIKRAFNRVKAKYKEIISAYKQGLLAGYLSSISSTVINIFATTAKNVGRILRESWAAVVESVKILVFNPDNLPFGEMLRAVMKIIATTVSVIIGGLVQEAVGKMNLVPIPGLADVVPIFLGSLVTGIMSVTMLYFLDNSKIVARIVAYANRLKDKYDHALEYYREVHARVVVYAAQLEGIDYETLENEVRALRKLNMKLGAAKDGAELNLVLVQAIKDWGIDMPYSTREEMDAFMNDKDAILII